METTTHEKVIFRNVESKNNPNLVEQLIDAYIHLDIERIAELIPEDAEYENHTNKYGFLAEYKNLFESIQQDVELPLMVLPSFCNHCSLKEVCKNEKQIYSFFGNNDFENNQFSIVFELKNDGSLLEMYRCYVSVLTLESKLFVLKKRMGLV